MRNTRYLTSTSLLKALRPFVQTLKESGAPSKWAQTALVYVSNKFGADSYQPQRLHTPTMRSTISVTPKMLVKAGILRVDGEYYAGKHSRSYLLTREYQLTYKKAFIAALESGEERYDVRYGPGVEVPAEALEIEDYGIDDVLSQVNWDAGVPVLDCIRFAKDPTSLMHLESYLAKTKKIEMMLNVSEVRRGIQHGLDLVKSSPEGSPEEARGWSYIHSGQAILDRTKDSVFRPNYKLREFRLFESGLQQYPGSYNKDLVVDDPDVVNLDQQNSHPTIILQILDQLGLPAEPLREYVKDRDGVIEKLGLERTAVKVAMCSALNGAYVSKNVLFDKEGKPLSCFAPFLEAYGQGLRFGSVDMAMAKEHYDTFVDFLKPMKKSIKELSNQAEQVFKDSTRREGTYVGLLAMLVELYHKATFVMTNTKYLLNGDAHDGVLLYSGGTTARLSNVEANQVVGYTLNYEDKPLTSKTTSCSAHILNGGNSGRAPLEERGEAYNSSYVAGSISDLIADAKKGGASMRSEPTLAELYAWGFQDLRDFVEERHPEVVCDHIRWVQDGCPDQDPWKKITKKRSLTKKNITIAVPAMPPRSHPT